MSIPAYPCKVSQNEHRKEIRIYSTPLQHHHLKFSPLEPQLDNPVTREYYVKLRNPRFLNNGWHYVYGYTIYTAISIKVVHASKAEKSNTSAKGCWEPLWKFINLLAIPSSLSRSYSTFPLCSWTTLIEIAVYSTGNHCLHEFARKWPFSIRNKPVKWKRLFGALLVQ
jgi:hypothetical protein